MMTALGQAGIGSPRPHMSRLSATVAGLQNPAGFRWFEVYTDIEFGHPVSTFTATGDLVTGGVEVTGSGGFSPPVYTATGDLVTGGVEVTGSGGFSPPVYLAIGDLVSGGVNVAGSGGFSPPVYLATGDLVTGGVEVTGSGQFIVGNTATGDLVSGGVGVTGSGVFALYAPSPGRYRRGRVRWFKRKGRRP